MSNLVLSLKEQQNLADSLFPIHSIIDSISHAETKHQLKRMMSLIHRKVCSAPDSERFVKDLDFYIGYEFCGDWETAMKNERYEDGYKWEVPTDNDLLEICKCMDNPFTEDNQYWSNEDYCKTKATTYDFYTAELNTRRKKESNYYFYISRKGGQNGK
jgi:hypothetical protein